MQLSPEEYRHDEETMSRYVNRWATQVPVIHGANSTFWPSGQTILSAKTTLRHSLNIPYFAEAQLNGTTATVNRRLRPGDVLEFVNRLGRKGGEDIPREEAEGEALLRTYPSLMTMAEEVKRLGLGSHESINLMVRKVAEWCRDYFGPIEDRIKTTITHVVKEALTERAEAHDGPTNFGDLWLDGQCYELDLTALEILLVRALWKKDSVEIGEVMEQVYRTDDKEAALKAVKRRTNTKFEKR